MTTLHVVEVARAIAAMTIDGVTVAELEEMPLSATSRDLPLLAPAVDRAFLSDWVSRRISAQGNVAMAYTLNYTFYYAPFGQGRGLADIYPSLIAAVQTVVDAFNAVTRVNGCKRLELAGLPQVGLVRDASENQFHGALLALRVTEF